jgi:transposase
MILCRMAAHHATQLEDSTMRGDDRQQQAMFSYLSPEQRVPQDHPLRTIRTLVDDVLHDLSPTFDAIYAQAGRPSIPPEQLLRALLLQVLYTVRSERLLMEQLHYNLLFRWFVGLNMDEPVWDHSTFSKNRERFLDGDVAQAFSDRVLAQARERNLLSDEHFTVDATLLEAWASLKSFRPKDEPPTTPPDDPGNPTVDFHGERRSNDTHQSTTDPDARLYRRGKGREAKLCYMGHVVMENRHGLAVCVQATVATGTAEPDTAEDLVEQLVGDPDEPDVPLAGSRRRTVGADKAFDTEDFVGAMRDLNVTPHVAQSTTGRRSAIDGRTTRHPGYAISQKARKRVEEIFGWLKTVALMRKLRHRGTDRVDWVFVFTTAVYNLVRLGNILTAAVVETTE